MKKAVDGGTPVPPRPDDAQLPPPFVAPRFYVMDSTVERLAVLIEARPRGMLTIVDELAGLRAAMSRYNRGGDREFWLEAWNGGAHCIERLSRPPVSLAHLLVSITGGFQPSKLGRAFGGEEDGMAARYLYAWPAEPGYRPLTDEIEEADPDLQQALMRLIDLPAGDGSKVEPRTLPLDTPAREAFERFRQEVERQKGACDGREREAWAKAPAHVLRLAGTLAYMDWAMPDIVRPAAGSSMDQLREVARGAAEPTTIGAVYIESAVRMWFAYWWPHARAALRQIGGSEQHRDARRVLRWLRAQGRTEVSREDIRRDALAQALDAEGAERLMAELVQAGWLRQRPPERTGGRSRRRWDVNPLLLAAS